MFSSWQSGKRKAGGGECMGEMKRREGREGEEGKREQFIPPKDTLASKLLAQKRSHFLVSVISQEFI